ncbi:MAG: sel1 repeat family protein [Opitutae bacterium]|nr:sel1 repeat family protein [Opitutae bacterium]MBT7853952.1 sel1 repeat family protein [Opitutae bacterium]
MSSLSAMLILLCIFLGSCSKSDELSQLKKAANQGDTSAQASLAWKYLKGHGVQQDDKKAVEWYTKAAEQGDVRAQNNLGELYTKGDGVSRDDKEALKWYTHAARQGYAFSQSTLAKMYHKGEGVPQDSIHAHAWCHLAELNGHEESARLRKQLEKWMTPAEITSARELASTFTEPVSAGDKEK